MLSIQKIKRTLNWYRYRTGQIVEAISATVKFFFVNLFSRKKIISAEGPVVSLTSYGNRVKTVFLTIESIGHGEVLPNRIILWLDDKKIFNALPKSLIRLQKRGVEINLTKNYGPHTKYYPYLLSEKNFSLPLVTADDDMLYERKWLSELYAAFLANPELIHCHRARIIKIKGEQLEPLTKWPFAEKKEPNVLNFLEGVSGVIYPSNFLAHLKQAGEQFLDTCPKHDDVWLNVNALRNGFQIKQVKAITKHYPSIPGTNSVGLMHQNLGASGNSQVARAYTTTDISLLLSHDHP